MTPDEIKIQEKLLQINLSDSFSLYVVLLATEHEHVLENHGILYQNAMQDMIEKICLDPGIVAWETPQGIGVLDCSILPSVDEMQEEITKATQLKEKIDAYFPEMKKYIGIAAYGLGIDQFANRYIQARNTAVIGMNIYPNKGVYHFRSSGFFPVLTEHVPDREADVFIDHTIGKIIDYDQKNGTNLFYTMEQIVINSNLRSVADQLFIHYKTILFRKQSIERIVGISMDSFEGRTMFGMALTFYYLREYNRPK